MHVSRTASPSTTGAAGSGTRPQLGGDLGISFSIPQPGLGEPLCLPGSMLGCPGTGKGGWDPGLHLCSAEAWTFPENESQGALGRAPKPRAWPSLARCLKSCRLVIQGFPGVMCICRLWVFINKGKLVLVLVFKVIKYGRPGCLPQQKQREATVGTALPSRPRASRVLRLCMPYRSVCYRSVCNVCNLCGKQPVLEDFAFFT